MITSMGVHTIWEDMVALRPIAKLAATCHHGLKDINVRCCSSNSFLRDLEHHHVESMSRDAPGEKGSEIVTKSVRIIVAKNGYGGELGREWWCIK